MGTYKVYRYNDKAEVEGREEGEECSYEDMNKGKDVEEKKLFFVSPSESATGELYGAMRALEIYGKEYKEKKSKKVIIVCDRDGVQNGYRPKSGPEGNVAKVYRDFFKRSQAEGGFLEGVELEFEQVRSHGQYLVDEKEDFERWKKEADKYTYKYPHAVYNDLVDCLAKAETGKKINAGEDFNVFRVISDKFMTFWEYEISDKDESDKIEKRRRHARNLVEDVLEKENGRFRPVFPAAGGRK